MRRKKKSKMGWAMSIFVIILLTFSAIGYFGTQDNSSGNYNKYKIQNIGDKCDYCGKSVMMRRYIELWDKKKVEEE